MRIILTLGPVTSANAGRPENTANIILGIIHNAPRS